MMPPRMEARVPPREIPPFVPGGTGLRVVMRMGLEWERMPSSEARVSPRQQAKCLNMSPDCVSFHRFALMKIVCRWIWSWAKIVKVWKESPTYPNVANTSHLLHPDPTALERGHHESGEYSALCALISSVRAKRSNPADFPNIADHNNDAINAEKELHSTCHPVRYPASW